MSDKERIALIAQIAGNLLQGFVDKHGLEFSNDMSKECQKAINVAHVLVRLAKEKVTSHP